MECKQTASATTKRQHRLLCVLVCLAFVIGFSAAAYARLPMNQFGKNWVRTHKFQIINGTTHYSTYIPVEWSSILALHTTGFWNGGSPIYSANDHGLTKHTYWAVGDGSVDEDGNIDYFLQTILPLTPYDDADAWYLCDEPVEDDIDDCGVIADWLKISRPNGLVYVNVCAMTDVDTVISEVQPDILMGDFYPIWWSGENAYYFQYIKEWRDKAIAQSIPYFAWVQAFEEVDAWREPSESQMRMNVWSHLTMGYKGIGWWFYDDAGPGCNWLMDVATRQPRDSYYWSQSINSEIEKQGRYLRFLTNTGVGYIANEDNPTPTGMTDWQYGAGGDNYIQGIYLEEHTPTNANQDALIGFFTDDSGQRYFMVQNLWRGPDYDDDTAYYKSSAISIYFGNSNLPVPGKVYKLDRSTGQSVEITLNQGTIPDLYPPGGTAELFSYQPFSLVGKDTVAPTRASVSINSGAGTTSSTSVTLTLSADDDSYVHQVCFSNDGTSWGGWQTYTTSMSHTLASGSGMRTVYAKFRDEAGNVSSVCSDTIWLSSSTGVLINEGATYTSTAGVTLNLYGTAGATYMSFSNDNSTWSNSVTYSTTYTGWNLSSGDGQKTVYVRFYNGSWSGSYTDTIVRCSDPGERVMLKVLWRCLTGSDRFTTYLPSERDAYTCEGQTWYVPNQSSGSTQPLYQLFDVDSGTDHWDYDEPYWSSHEYYRTLGHPWSSAQTATQPVTAKSNCSEWATVSTNESLAGYTCYTLNLGHGYPRYNNLAESLISLTDSTGYTTIASDLVYGGTLSHWTWNSTQFINQYFAGRNMQAWLQWADRWAMEGCDQYCLVSGGSPRNNHGAPLNSYWNDGYQGTTAVPLEYLPGKFGGGPDNPVAYKDITLGKQVWLNYHNLNSGADYAVSAYWTLALLPSSVYNATLCMPNVYLRGLFNTIYTFDASGAGTLTQQTPAYGSGGTFMPASGYAGVILANGTSSSATALGFFGINKTKYPSNATGIDHIWYANLYSGGGTGELDAGCMGLAAKRVGDLPTSPCWYCSFVITGTRGNVQLAMRKLVPPTGTVVINGGAATTNTTAVTLTLSATANEGAVTSMCFSNDNVNWSSWENYSTSKAWTLTSGAGVKTVYAKFRDNNGDGNVSLIPASDTIQLL